MTWNPSAPDALGVEWFPTRAGAAPLSGLTTAVAFLLDAQSTETIDGLYLPHTWSGAASCHGKLWADIYDLADVGAGAAITTYTYVPNEDETRGSWFGGVDLTTGDTSNIFDYIDGGAFTTDRIYRSSTPGTSVDPAVFHFNTATFPANTRPLAIYLDVYTAASGLQSSITRQGLYLYNNASLSAQVVSAGVFPAPPAGGGTNYLSTTLGPFYVNPITDEPWSRQDILDFDSSSGPGWGFDGIASNGGYVHIYFVNMRVLTIPEKRVAMGACTTQTAPPSGVQTNLPVSLKTPALVDNFAKANGTDYLTVVRRLDDGALLSGLATATPSLLWVDAATANPHGQATERAVTVDSTGQVLTVGDTGTKAYGAVWGTSGGAFSPDSCVYHSVEAFACATGMEVRQRVTASASIDYTAARILVGVIPGTVPTSDLTVTVRNAGTNAQVGGVGTVTWPDDLEALTPRAFTNAIGTTAVRLYEVLVEFASDVPLVSGTTYYVEFTSTTATTVPWAVGVLSFLETNALTGNESFGGATLYATADGTDYAASRDLPMVLLSEVAGTVLSVTRADATADDTGPDSCDAGPFYGAKLTWTATALGSDFAYYEVQRSDQDGNEHDAAVMWRTVRRGTVESVKTWTDWEMQSGVPVQYRVRVVRTDGGISAWSTVSVTVPQAAGTVVLTCNQDTSRNAAFVQLGPVHEWTGLAAGQRVLGQFYDRDYSVEFRPTERAGVGYQFTVIVYASLSGTPAGGATLPAFDRLRGLTDASDLPYVCLRLPQGLRVFGSLVLGGNMSWDAQQNVYLAACALTETTAVPMVAEG